MIDADKPDAMANGLTKARVAMVLALPSDGSWGRVPSRSVAKRAWRKMLPSVIDHKHCPEDANEWSLTDFGIRIQSQLRAQQGSAGGEDL